MDARIPIVPPAGGSRLYQPVDAPAEAPPLAAAAPAMSYDDALVALQGDTIPTGRRKAVSAYGSGTAGELGRALSLPSLAAMGAEQARVAGEAARQAELMSTLGMLRSTERGLDRARGTLQAIRHTLGGAGTSTATLTRAIEDSRALAGPATPKWLQLHHAQALAKYEQAAKDLAALEDGMGTLKETHGAALRRSVELSAAKLKEPTAAMRAMGGAAGALGLAGGMAGVYCGVGEVLTHGTAVAAALQAGDGGAAAREAALVAKGAAETTGGLASGLVGGELLANAMAGTTGLSSAAQAAGKAIIPLAGTVNLIAGPLQIQAADERIPELALIAARGRVGYMPPEAAEAARAALEQAVIEHRTGVLKTAAGALMVGGTVIGAVAAAPAIVAGAGVAAIAGGAIATGAAIAENWHGLTRWLAGK